METVQMQDQKKRNESFELLEQLAELLLDFWLEERKMKLLNHHEQSSTEKLHSSLPSEHA